MTPRASGLPSGFLWLSPIFRPSPQEVETYARIIHALEAHPPERFDSCLREAELQIWSWRNQSGRRGLRRPRAEAGTKP